jgi:hypothetical protein
VRDQNFHVMKFLHGDKQLSRGQPPFRCRAFAHGRAALCQGLVGIVLPAVVLSTTEHTTMAPHIDTNGNLSMPDPDHSTKERTTVLVLKVDRSDNEGEIRVTPLGER